MAINLDGWRFLWISLAAFLVGGNDAAADPAGSIGGRIAIQAVPDDSVPAPDCEVHLVETKDQAHERIYPCAVWFQPPIGRYLFWIEQGQQISLQSVLRYAGEPFTSSGLLLAKSMMPAGFVELDRGTHLPPDATFRLISLRDTGDQRAFDRRVGANAKHRVRMPAGKVLAGIFDRKGRALSVTRPEIVETGAPTTVRPVAPRPGHAGIVAVLTRPPTRRCDATVAGRRAQVELAAGDRFVAVWYDLTAPAVARFDVQCGATLGLVREIRLEPGVLATIRENVSSPPPPR